LELLCQKRPETEKVAKRSPVRKDCSHTHMKPDEAKTHNVKTQTPSSTAKNAAPFFRNLSQLTKSSQVTKTYVRLPQIEKNIR
jgi:hypothetical protein